MQYQNYDKTREVVQMKQTIIWIINSTRSLWSRSDFITSITNQARFIRGKKINSITPKPGVHGPEGEKCPATQETLKYKV